ncbi:hypothetical protein ACNKHS_25035 [Shigella flexneri]
MMVHRICLSTADFVDERVATVVVAAWPSPAAICRSTTIWVAIPRVVVPPATRYALHALVADHGISDRLLESMSICKLPVTFGGGS